MKRKFLTISVAALAAVSVVLSSGCQTMTKTPAPYRQPASTEDLFTGADRVSREVQNDSIFNAHTCPAYINTITDYLYGLNSGYFIPKTSDEVARLKDKGVDLMKSLFQIRVALREKYQQFDERNELTQECVLKVREGIQYSRITEEYLLEWLVHNKVVDARTPKILEADPVYTLTNPKFQDFKLQTGDVMLVRGKSYVSAMIARIGDEEGNFSHLALVGEDKNGQQYIVEALIQTGVIITPLEKWREAQDARVALFRYKDAALAQQAGRMMYDYSREKLAKNGEIRYDFSMDDSEDSSFFCSEVASYAYKLASKGTVILPKFRSSLTKFKDSTYPKTLGVTKKTLFAPYDIEADPRFDFVAEYKFYPLLRQVRMQDAVLQSVYGWIINKGYDFKFAAPFWAKAAAGKTLRQFGKLKDVLPKYMPLQTIKTTAEFESVATTLEKNLYAKEAEYYQKNGYLPTFHEFMSINEDFRKSDCETHKNFWKLKSTKRSEFHWFFRSKSTTCE